jgi:hypothetical protein
LQSELFLKCWQHNLKWSDTLIKEYFAQSITRGYGIRLVFKYGVAEANKLIRRCKDEYDYDMKAMIKDVRSGKVKVGPLPARMLYKVVKH